MLSSTRSLILLREEVRNNSEEMFDLIDSVAEILLPTRHGKEEPVLVRQAAGELLIFSNFRFEN